MKRCNRFRDPVAARQPVHLSYTPYGYRPVVDKSPLGFTGQLLDPVSGAYALGNGYRFFAPSLMRFRSPDNRSPFAEGGINAYAYCAGDPVNRRDPSGRAPAPLIPQKPVGALLSPGRKGFTASITGRSVLETVKVAEFNGAEGIRVPLGGVFDGMQTSDVRMNVEGVIWNHTWRDTPGVISNIAVSAPPQTLLKVSIPYTTVYEHAQFTSSGVTVQLPWSTLRSKVSIEAKAANIRLLKRGGRVPKPNLFEGTLSG